MGVLEEILTKMEQLDCKIQRLLDEKNGTTAADAVLNIDGACDLTGYTKSALYYHTRNRTIPHYKHEGKLRFKASELNAWMLGKRVLTQEDINTRAATYVTIHNKKL